MGEEIMSVRDVFVQVSVDYSSAEAEAESRKRIKTIVVRLCCAPRCAAPPDCCVCRLPVNPRPYPRTYPYLPTPAYPPPTQDAWGEGHAPSSASAALALRGSAASTGDGALVERAPLFGFWKQFRFLAVRAWRQVRARKPAPRSMYKNPTQLVMMRVIKPSSLDTR